MVKALGYIWALFGAYWIIFAPALASATDRAQKARLTLLALTFGLLLWYAPIVPPSWVVILGVTWAGLGLSWVSPRKAEHSGENPLYRLVRLFVGAITFSLLFWRATAIGILGKRFVLDRNETAELGFALCITGLGLATWARIHLGRYWSDKVVIQAEHRLVRSGPYARMRHPIYSGVLLAIVGTALVVGEVRALLALVVMSINYTIKAKREDKILALRFGKEFRDYRAHSGLLIPRFWRPAPSK